ncbi:hypothetical protein [Nocardia sp. NPDC004415]
MEISIKVFDPERGAKEEMIRGAITSYSFEADGILKTRADDGSVQYYSPAYWQKVTVTND